jgi:hypothetical protein
MKVFVSTRRNAMPRIVEPSRFTDPDAVAPQAEAGM